MIRISKNTVAQVLLVLFLMQQGIATVAIAASQMQQPDGAAVATLGHDCESMSVQDDVHSGGHAAATESSQHDHQDCIDSGCDDCVGCVACAVGYRNSFNIIVSGRPVGAPVYIAMAIPEPDLLYRPPIVN